MKKSFVKISVAILIIVFLLTAISISIYNPQKTDRHNADVNKAAKIDSANETNEIMQLNNTGTVEEILNQVNKIEDTEKSFTLWIPQDLTLNGKTVSSDVAMAIILDAILAKEFFPNGFDQGIGGKYYKYQK